MKVTAYVDELRGELSRLGVPGGEVEQIVAEVRSHVAETGEEPVEAFGPAGVYAAAYAAPGASARDASRAGDGIPAWAKVVLAMIALVVGPYVAVMLLAVPLAAVSGGVTGVELLALVVTTVVVAALVWVVVRAYCRREGASTFGAWVVGAGTLVALVAAAVMLGTAGTQWAGSPLAPHPAELAFTSAPVLAVAVVVALVFRAAGPRRRG